jgi:hypothetical protein
MTLSQEVIRQSKSDDELFQLLSTELSRLFPPKLQEDADLFYASLLAVPRGLRAMAGTYELDVSMSLDDLAWHFLNHNNDRFLTETLNGLKELDANEAADLFSAAWDIVKPFLPEIRTKNWDGEEPHEYLDKTGIQSRVDPLNKRMWAICKERGDKGLMEYWLAYAQKYPERCVAT